MKYFIYKLASTSDRPKKSDLLKEQVILNRITVAAKKQYPEKNGLPLLACLLESPFAFNADANKHTSPRTLKRRTWLQKEMMLLCKIVNLKLANIMNKSLGNLAYDIELYNYEHELTNNNKINLYEYFNLPKERFVPGENDKEFLDEWLLKGLDLDKVKKIFKDKTVNIDLNKLYKKAKEKLAANKNPPVKVKDKVKSKEEDIQGVLF